MECPGCGRELTNVWAARSVELHQVSEGGEWIEKNVFSSGVSCPHCHEELDDDIIAKLGITGY